MTVLTCQSVISSLSQPVEVSLEALFDEYGWESDDVLNSLKQLGDVLDELKLEIIPSLREGGLAEPRVLRKRESDNPSAAVQLELDSGEGDRIEFKETLLLDTKKHLLGGKPVSDCKSEEVLFSALKTIAAFLNTNGGTLILGATDDAQPISIEREFVLTSPKGPQNFDQWELFFRAKIEQHFTDGKAINGSVLIGKASIGKEVVARVVVGTRNAISILNTPDGPKLFVRTGNKTVAVELADLEKFFELKKLYL